MEDEQKEEYGSGELKPGQQQVFMIGGQGVVGDLVVVFCSGRTFMGFTEQAPDKLSEKVRNGEHLTLEWVIELHNKLLPAQVNRPTLVSPQVPPPDIRFIHEATTAPPDLAIAPIRKVTMLPFGYYLVRDLSSDEEILRYAATWLISLKQGEGKVKKVAEERIRAEERERESRRMQAPN